MTPENSDDLKGRLKEGAGDITGDKDLQREGKVDQASGKLKAGLDGVTDAVKGVVGKGDKS